jgi:hypothetical protein
MNPDLPTPARVARIVALSALYDLLVTGAFATPWTARLAVAQLASLHTTLGLRGLVPSIDGVVPLFFANLMGSLVVVWALVRLRARTAFLGAADTLGRVLFSTWMIYGLIHGATPLLGVLLVLEIGWGIVQGAAVLVAVSASRAVDRTVPV